MAGTRTTRRPAAKPAPKPAPAPAKAKKTPPAPAPCGCGCGELTPRRFRPGHDMRIPQGALCAASGCGTEAGFGIGRVPACDDHVAPLLCMAIALASTGRVAVRAL